MCNPLVLLGTAVAAAVTKKVLSPGSSNQAPPAAAVDPAVERAQAEAEAAQKANSRLANDQRRRREQGSLMARGAPTFTMGDNPDAANPGSPISSPSASTTSRSSVAKQSSLMSRGGPLIVDGGGGAGARGSGPRFGMAAL